MNVTAYNQEESEELDKRAQLDLSSLLNRTDIKLVIQSPEFFFQKGQDALKKWLNFSVSEELKTTLIVLSKDYKKIQDEAAKRPDIKQVLDLLFEVISYCDNHAKDKNILNQYDDKRALADAFVRMNSWIEKLIQYRFLPDEVGIGSTQNAFNYLLDPENNSTVLSENHRKQISENFIRIPYNPKEFPSDLKSFFASYNLKTVNPQNYSHLLMHIVYSFQNEWRKEEKGPMSTRFLNVIEKVKRALDDDPHAKGLFVFDKPSRDFVWIKDSHGLIGNHICHYEISVNKTPSLYTVDVHFEGKELSDYQKFNPILNSLPNELIRFPWRKKGDSIRFGNGIPIDHPDLVNELKDQLVYMEENIGDKLREIIKGNKIPETINDKYPLNQILYGPPGTGKTYNTILKTAEIIMQIKGLSYDDALEIFDSYLHERIEFITFHQNYSYEDFIQGLRPDVENNQLRFEKKDGIFKQLADRALKNLKDSEENNKTPLNYVLIIDEINRANISRVFGELITLIECDKRSHGKMPIPVTLPSGDEFIVPSNLYIIGTMNTADKSIALLDIALRRRFEFVPMYPLYEIVGKNIHDVEILKNINEQIIIKKGHDFQIGHSYFMDEETSYNQVERMNKKVIPLLLEYFMNDKKEVEGILTKAGLQVVKDSWPIEISAS